MRGVGGVLTSACKAPTGENRPFDSALFLWNRVGDNCEVFSRYPALYASKNEPGIFIGFPHLVVYISNFKTDMHDINRYGL